MNGSMLTLANCETAVLSCLIVLLGMFSIAFVVAAARLPGNHDDERH